MGETLPIPRHDRIPPDIQLLGFRFVFDLVQRGAVFLFLEFAAHVLASSAASLVNGCAQ